MKTLAKFVGAALVGAFALFAAPAAQAQVRVNVNIGAPAWGPQVPYGTQYYYIPEIDGYYDLYSQQYLVYDDGYWVPLPQLYGYDPYQFHPVAIAYRGREPWCQLDYYHQRYTYQPYCHYGRGGYGTGYYANGYGRSGYYPNGGYYGGGRGYNGRDHDDRGRGYGGRDHDDHDGRGNYGGYGGSPRGGQPQYPGNYGGGNSGSGNYGGSPRGGQPQAPQLPQPGGYGQPSGGQSGGQGGGGQGQGGGQGNGGSRHRRD